MLFLCEAHLPFRGITKYRIYSQVTDIFTSCHGTLLLFKIIITTSQRKYIKELNVHGELCFIDCSCVLAF